jgi:hypothetical protein
MRPYRHPRKGIPALCQNHFKFENSLPVKGTTPLVSDLDAIILTADRGVASRQPWAMPANSPTPTGLP